MEHYHLGQTVTLTFAFVDTDGAPADPDEFTFELQQPDGDLATIDPGDIQNPVVGTITYSPTYDQAGEWTWRIVGVIGATAVVDTDRDWVWDSPITGA